MTLEPGFSTVEMQAVLTKTSNLSCIGKIVQRICLKHTTDVFPLLLHSLKKPLKLKKNANFFLYYLFLTF